MTFHAKTRANRIFPQVPNYQHELSRRFLETCSPKLHPDLKTHLRNFNDWAGGAKGGFGRFELSQWKGERWTGANSYLAVAAARPNVTVLTGHIVTRVTLEEKVFCSLQGAIQK